MMPSDVVLQVSNWAAQRKRTYHLWVEVERLDLSAEKKLEYAQTAIETMKPEQQPAALLQWIKDALAEGGSSGK